jgi:hypothetical protein
MASVQQFCRENAEFVNMLYKLHYIDVVSVAAPRPSLKTIPKQTPLSGLARARFVPLPPHEACTALPSVLHAVLRNVRVDLCQASSCDPPKFTDNEFYRAAHVVLLRDFALVAESRNIGQGDNRLQKEKKLNAFFFSFFTNFEFGRLGPWKELVRGVVETDRSDVRWLCDILKQAFDEYRKGAVKPERKHKEFSEEADEQLRALEHDVLRAQSLVNYQIEHRDATFTQDELALVTRHANGHFFNDLRRILANHFELPAPRGDAGASGARASSPTSPAAKRRRLPS